MHRPDPILDELRRIREERAARHNHDIKSMVREIQEYERESGREYVTLPPRKPRWIPAPESPEAGNES